MSYVSLRELLLQLVAQAPIVARGLIVARQQRPQRACQLTVQLPPVATTGAIGVMPQYAARQAPQLVDDPINVFFGPVSSTDRCNIF